ncbi:MAG: NAD(P)H-hydrate epimerase [Gemmatales bacterium]|nr:NAD(P)H-hydrate epimerase [Gemmatales bacterium]MDW8388228.1 NAD(P)H-hydrate epimerase [Gemmatales bacterium]
MNAELPGPALSCKQIRAFDAFAVSRLGVPSLILMENAGRGAAELLLALGVKGPVVVCCGKGNNGGDGLVIARHLWLADTPVHVVLMARPDELTGDARVNLEICRNLHLSIESIPQPDQQHDRVARLLVEADWIVDALLGSGLTGPPKPPYDRMIDLINASAPRVFAVDIPSGLDADTGRPLGVAVRAAHTATFAALKKGFLDPQSRHWTGQVHLLHIGVPITAMPTSDA